MRDEYHWHFRRRPWEYSITARFWGRRLNHWLLRSLFSWSWIDGVYRVFDFDLYTINQGRCYCPTGSTTTFIVQAFGFGFRFWITRDRGISPCLCELAVCEALPDLYADEINEIGGMDRVKQLIEQRQRWLTKIGK